MIFLKKIELFAFKSFANKTVIKFDNKITGIVGPNGVGKSNINDAIRWVFGETSLKLLRTNERSDVIFNGSENKLPLNYCEVKLVFDNRNHIFDLEFEEVQIARRIFRDSNESIYFINNVKSKLKEVQLLAKESGLAKTSLTMISQGNVSSFSDSKPDERRLLLEDASGILKYKQRKIESLRKLSRCKDNINNVLSVIEEIERNLPLLKIQANKAKIYKIKSDRLKEIEVQIIYKDISFFKEKEISLTSLLTNLQSKANELKKFIKIKALQFEKNQKEFNKIDALFFNLNKEYNKCVNEINVLKIKQIELQNNQKIENSKDTISFIKNQYDNLNLELNIENKKIKNCNQEDLKLKSQSKILEEKQLKLNIKLNILKQSKKEYENKINRIRLDIYNSSQLFLAPKKIIENKNNLLGIIDLVKNIITTDSKYSIAISKIVNPKAQNIIVTNKNSAKYAIAFLKQNKLGSATFIPLDLKYNQIISADDLFILKSIKGFIDIASNLVTYDKKFFNIINYILGNHIICKDIDSGLKIAKLLNYKKYITILDGTQIRPFGILNGGSLSKNSNLFINNNLKLKDIKLKYETLINNLNSLNLEHSMLLNDQKNIENAILQNNFIKNNITKLITEISNKIMNLKKSYDFLSDDLWKTETKDYQTIYKKLENQIIKKDQLEKRINDIQNQKTELLNSILSSNKIIKEKQNYLSDIELKLNETEKNILKVKNILDNLLTHLTKTYNLTYDGVINDISNETEIRREIDDLKLELKKIGNVSLETIDQYEKANNRYNLLKKEYDQFMESFNHLKKVIKEIDQIMIDTFSKTIININKNLKETFKILFKGGSAELVYVDPENILTSGIDIKVHLLGKKITKIALLSGGEKSLVAISVLFAILKTNPLPLVVLDEVEAALDHVNQQKFAKYLHIFTKKTQFLVVTHRMATMQECNVLYGVTMQEKGVTKILQLKLVDAYKLTNNQNQIN